MRLPHVARERHRGYHASCFEAGVPESGSTSRRRTVQMGTIFTKSLGTSLLAVWLILTGLIPLINLSFSGLSMLMAILAIAAGALLLAGR
jgi:hypothetical protein